MRKGFHSSFTGAELGREREGGSDFLVWNSTYTYVQRYKNYHLFARKDRTHAFNHR